VHFDELKITYTESPVLQVNAYYPFGMMAYTWLRDGEKENLYGYQGKEYDSLTRWHDFHARQYDGALGRWFANDPKGSLMPGISNYAAMMNNPMLYVDPDGECPICIPIFIGAFMNVTMQGMSGNINCTGDFFKAAFIGGLAGAAGYGAGAFVSGYVGTVGFTGGALTGAAGGFAGGFVGGAGNAWANGASFGQGLKSGLVGCAYGTLTGEIIGGVSGGITSVKHGGNFWSGEGATFASIAIGDPIAGVPEEYSTENAVTFSKKHFSRLKYYDKVQLKADGTNNGYKDYMVSGDYFLTKDGEKTLAFTYYKGTGRGSDIVFAKSAFASARQLYLTMGHEYIHAGFFNIGGWDLVNIDRQHASIYKWELEVSNRWGRFNRASILKIYNKYKINSGWEGYKHKRFF
jgi:RHS repeat-associated protein